MRGPRKIILSLLLATALSACGTARQMGPAPVYHYGSQAQSYAGAGDMIVKKNDTLWCISKRYNVELRDVIDANGLAPPYLLATGQRLRLPPPMQHRVKQKDTLYQISRMYGVPVSQLVRINGLKKPYHLRVGQDVRIPSTVVRRRETEQPRHASAKASPAAPILAAHLSASPTAQKRTQQKAPSRYTAPSKPAMSVRGSTDRFIWPVKGKVISSYGPKEGKLFNDGINIAAPRGAPVRAAADGVVAYAGKDLASYGNLVLVRHTGGLVTAYAHLNNISVKKGDRVTQGHPLGSVGSTGTVANSQLHFEVRRGIKTYNPVKYL